MSLFKIWILLLFDILINLNLITLLLENEKTGMKVYRALPPIPGNA